MMISLDAVGFTSPVGTTTLERGRLAFFARAIGETDPVYSDVEAALAAGHPDLPVPPTFLFSLNLESADPFCWLTDLGVDLTRLLHGSQGFTYNRPVHAGDTVTHRRTITSVYTKRAGALEFLESETEVRLTGGDRVALLQETLIVQHPEGA